MARVFFLYAHMGPSPRLPGLLRCFRLSKLWAIFKSHWFCGAWSTVQKPSSIAYKELFPIIVTASLWGSQWVVQRVKFLCDNESVVVALKTGTSQDQNLMLLLRYLTMLAIHYLFSFTTSSVRGKDNPVADALSRFQFQRFRSLVPLADVASAQIPASLLAADSEVSISFNPRTCTVDSASYLSAQRRCLNFCRKDGRANLHGPPADEESLMRFATVFADNLNHSSIKVCLYAVRSILTMAFRILWWGAFACSTYFN